jgi:hypothetical protein
VSGIATKNGFDSGVLIDVNDVHRIRAIRAFMTGYLENDATPRNKPVIEVGELQRRYEELDAECSRLEEVRQQRDRIGRIIEHVDPLAVDTARSVPTRVIHFLQCNWQDTFTCGHLTEGVNATEESVKKALVKLTAEGSVERYGRGYYGLEAHQLAEFWKQFGDR